ncbi:MAG: hypothetical protein KatS3mg102_2908 [Planctomycetota bacterium]|nr:MAG: hypothetical protein KatS3mg102_2908 [Planctomycetota bacterium]
MALIERSEFELGKRKAAAHWRAAGQPEVAAAFLALELSACRFGLDQYGRLVWGRVAELEVGLRFETESGALQTSFYRRLPPPPPPPAAPPAAGGA